MSEKIHPAACACRQCTPPGPRPSGPDRAAAFTLFAALLLLILPAVALFAQQAGFTWGTI